MAGAKAGCPAAGRGGPGRFVLVQHGRGAAGLAKTLRLEAPADHHGCARCRRAAEARALGRREVAATTGFSEAFYDADGTRRVPALRAMPVEPASRDVLLELRRRAAGDGRRQRHHRRVRAGDGHRQRGLARAARPLRPRRRTRELSANLRRMADAGVTVRYARADVTDAARCSAVAELTRALGPVTAVLHGAGRNEPASVINLDMAAFRSTFAPKIDGLRAVLRRALADDTASAAAALAAIGAPVGLGLGWPADWLIG